MLTRALILNCMSLYSPSDIVHAKHKLNNDGRGKVDHRVELKLGQRGLLLVLCFVRNKTNRNGKQNKQN